VVKRCRSVRLRIEGCYVFQPSTTFFVFICILDKWWHRRQLGVKGTSHWRKGATNRPRNGTGRSAQAHPGPVRLLPLPSCPSWHFSFLLNYLCHFGTNYSSNKTEVFSHELPSLRSGPRRCFYCITLVLATFGSISSCTWIWTELLLWLFDIDVSPSFLSVFSYKNITLQNAHTKLNLLYH
jgi:hypothetical protein